MSQTVYYDRSQIEFYSQMLGFAGAVNLTSIIFQDVIPTQPPSNLHCITSTRVHGPTVMRELRFIWAVKMNLRKKILYILLPNIYRKTYTHLMVFLERLLEIGRAHV